MRPAAHYEVYPAFSPDGRWLAYSSNESGMWEVCVRHFPVDGTQVRVSADGGRVPRRSPNGRDLFYSTDNQRSMVAQYDASRGRFVAAPPRPWSRHRLADAGVFPNFDLGPDGRMLALIPERSLTHPENAAGATVIIGFFGMLGQRP